MSWTWLPNTITLLRCALAFVTAWAILYSPFWIALGLFGFTAITDFLDGYLARRLNAVSAFGAFLDPIADKLLVALSLLALCANHEWTAILVIPAFLIIARDLGITLLRLRPSIELPVSRFAKWKTAAEMVGIFVLLGAPLLDGTARAFSEITGFGLVGFAALLSIWTGFQYVQTAATPKQNDRT
jgi:CDP-diacylglycerol--glycerol-3-phosphate 3-phosphatidyltransferase